MRDSNEDKVLALFGSNLKQIRESRGYSQELLAEKSGLDRTYISGCERGIRNPSLLSISKIAVSLGVSPSDLLSAVEM